MASHARLTFLVIMIACWQVTCAAPTPHLPLTLRLRGGLTPEPRQGDWGCDSCKSSNFRWRMECYRCGDRKGSNQRSGYKTGPSSEPSLGGQSLQGQDHEHERGRLIALREASFGPDGRREPQTSSHTESYPGKRARSPTGDTAKERPSTRARRHQRTKTGRDRRELE